MCSLDYPPGELRTLLHPAAPHVRLSRSLDALGSEVASLTSVPALGQSYNLPAASTWDVKKIFDSPGCMGPECVFDEIRLAGPPEIVLSPLDVEVKIGGSSAVVVSGGAEGFLSQFFGLKQTSLTKTTRLGIKGVNFEPGGPKPRSSEYFSAPTPKSFLRLVDSNLRNLNCQSFSLEKLGLWLRGCRAYSYMHSTDAMNSILTPWIQARL